MFRPGLVTSSLLAAGGALGLSFLLVFARGGGMFSPGALNGQQRTNTRLGGAASHADLEGRCSACHVPPWGRATMSERCLDCHTDIRRQIDSRLALHGQLSEGQPCRACHTEHKGSHAALTDLAAFDHDRAAFRLTGKHRETACQACHAGPVYKGTPQTCNSCHTEPSAHAGRFGTDCAGCHTTATWAGATFAHRFPLNHGTKKQGPSTCATCHPAANDFKTYTCYGCHAHTADRIERKHHRIAAAELADCVRCHANGREHDREHRRDFRRKRERGMEREDDMGREIFERRRKRNREDR